jgi:hypothetical protein
LKSDFTATVLDDISVSAANALAALTTGVVTAQIADHVAATLATLETGHAWTISVTGTATAEELNTINGSTSVVVVATGVTAISGTAAAFNTLFDYVNTGTINLALGFTASVSDSLSVDGANDLASLTIGVVTATLTSGELTSFSGLLETGNAYTIAITDLAPGTLLATDLSALGNKTTAAVTVNNAVTITGTASELTAALVTAETKVLAATATVTVSNALTGAADIATLNAIAAETTGNITAGLTATADELASLSTAATDLITITVSDANRSLGATTLSALGGKTAGNFECYRSSY